jgi:hypothetical protein
MKKTVILRLVSEGRQENDCKSCGEMSRSRCASSRIIKADLVVREGNVVISVSIKEAKVEQ